MAFAVLIFSKGFVLCYLIGAEGRSENLGEGGSCNIRPFEGKDLLLVKIREYLADDRPRAPTVPSAL